MANPREIAFSTLLKLLALSDAQRRTEIKKRLLGKGYAYWRPLVRATSKILDPTSTLSLLSDEIDKASSEIQAKHNKNAFGVLWKWISEHKCEPSEPLPELVVEFGESGFFVHINPEVVFVLDGNVYAMTLWATTKPALSKNVLSIGLKLMKDAYKAKGYTPRFVIFDTVGNVLFNEIDIVSNTDALSKLKEQALLEDWESVVGGTPGKSQSQKKGPAAPPPP